MKRKKIKPLTLYFVIATSFCMIAVLSNLLSAKLIALPLIPLTIPAGLIVYPIVFLLSDLVTELFGAKRAKLMVYVSLAMNLLSLGLIQLTLMMPSTNLEQSLLFKAVLGLSCLRVFSSLIAYITSQLVNIQLYAAIKRWTNSRFLWLRNNGATCISQMVDTVVIDLIFLWWGLKMPFTVVAPIMLFSYLYKVFFSVACTPLFYLLVFTFQGKKLQFEKVFRFTKQPSIKGPSDE